MRHLVRRSRWHFLKGRGGRTLVVMAVLGIGTLTPLRAAAPPAPSEVVFPTQRIPLKFSHKEHLGYKLQCDFCHERAETSTSSADSLIPPEEVCRTCHKIDRNDPKKEAIPEAACEACHTSADPAHPDRVQIPAPHIKFNHKAHAAKGIGCQRCHGDLRQVDLATRAQLPTMPLCLSCHSQNAQEHRANSRCTTCHPPRPDGTLETHFASGTLVPSGTLKGDAHTAHFVTDHARVGQDERYCANCHRRDFCLSCHNGVVKPVAFHPNDYLSIHPIEARKESLSCNGCHRRQTFCLGCHERAGLTDARTINAPGSVSLGAAGRRFHPPYERWVAPPRTPEHHSWQAERNLRACISCHREDTCLQCHSALPGQNAPFQVNPHPPGFGDSNNCRALAARNGRMCLKCHAPGDSNLTCR
jgi:hypothetical protein